MQRKSARTTKQMHARLFRCAVAFAMITALATGDEIVPRRLATARTRDHVVQRQLRRRELLPAILATGVITQQNVLARQRTPLVWDMPVLGQSDHRRRV